MTDHSGVAQDHLALTEDNSTITGDHSEVMAAQSEKVETVPDFIFKIGPYNTYESPPSEFFYPNSNERCKLTL